MSFFKNIFRKKEKSQVETFHSVDDQVAHLVSKLKSSNENEQLVAGAALVQIGEPAISPLINIIKDPRSNICEQAMALLALIGEPTVIPLIQSLKGAEPFVSKAITHILEQVGEPAISTLIWALHDPDYWVKYYVLQALKAITDQDFGEDVTAWLAWSRKPLLDNNSDNRIKETNGEISPTIATDPSVSINTKTGTELVNHLNEIFMNGDEEQKILAINEAEASRDFIVMESLAIAAKDDSSEIRSAALTILSQAGSGARRFNDPRYLIAVDELTLALTDSDESIQNSAITGLGAIGGPESEEALQIFINDTNNEELRLIAEMAMLFKKSKN